MHSVTISISIKNNDDLLKSLTFVMPDLVRKPEFIEYTGFRPAPE